MCLNKPVSIEPIEEYLRYWSLIPTHKLDPYAGIMSRMLWIPGHTLIFLEVCYLTLQDHQRASIYITLEAQPCLVRHLPRS